MSDQGSGTRLTIDDDNDLFPKRPAPNPLAPKEAAYPQKPQKPSDVFRFVGDIAAQYGQHVAQGLWDAGPGAVKRVMTGDVQPGTPEFNQLGAQSALAYGTLAAPMPRPYGSLGTFGGMGARYAPTSRLREVSEMEQGAWPRNAPASREEIFDKTGWHRGADGQWRFNISDKGAELQLDQFKSHKYVSPIDNKTTDLYNLPMFEDLKLGDILKHDELFNNYPALRDIEVKPTPIFDMMTTKGAYDKENNRLYLTGGRPEEMISTLLHEVQHAIQGREGFARGGSPSEFLPPKFDERLKYSAEQIKDLERELSTYGVSEMDLKRAHGLPPYGKPYPHLMPEADRKAALAVPQDFIDRYQKALDNRAELSKIQSEAFDQYEKLAGEIESRTVQAQHAKQEWDKLPEQTGDYESSFGGGKVVDYPTGIQIVKPQN